MKIIDLAEKQRNNEILPKHIRYENTDLYFDGVSYYDEEGNNTILDVLSANNHALTHLYDEVEIIEEEKKIPEKLGTYTITDETISGMRKSINTMINIDIIGTINEIIDYLENKK